MTSTTRYNDTLKLVETRLSGEVRSSDILAFIDDIIGKAIEHDCFLWLIDYADARFVLSTFEIYELPRKAWAKIEHLQERRYLVKRAIVSKNDRNDLSFLETTAKNIGQNLRIFGDVEAARQWLLQK